jgi:pilus assembly protein TadC
MVSFEKLVSRNVVVFLSDELDLAGVRINVNTFIELAIIGGFLWLIVVAFPLLLIYNYNAGTGFLIGIGAAVGYEILLYLLLEFRIEQRKNFMEALLPDYLQITAANIRSGIAMDKAMVLAARPEFKYFADDVKLTNKSVYAGETLQNSLKLLSKKYRSLQLEHTVRMISEAIQYGGGMTDMLNEVAKDLRNQHIIQKEISGQLFMYTIFIAFVALLGAPVLYGLTTEMITVTDTVWAGILKQNPAGLPTAGISFLRPSPPQISIAAYQNFALAAILIVTSFGAFIIATISSGQPIRGIRLLPIFVIVGVGVYLVVSIAIGSVFTTISGA